MNTYSQIYQPPFKPGIYVAELGGGLTPKFRPNYDMRKLPTVDHIIDFNKKFDIPDCSFHGVYSSYQLEHLSWRRVRPFLKEVFRILKPNGTAVFITANLLEQARVIVEKGELDNGLVCMVFGGHKFGTGNDLAEVDEELEEDWYLNAHFAGFCPKSITKMLVEVGFDTGSIKIIPVQTIYGATDIAIEATKPIVGVPIIGVREDKSMNSSSITNAEFKEIGSSSDMVKLNVGSFTVMNGCNWINVDNQDLSGYANQNGYIFKQIDVVASGLPYQDGSIDLISASHFIEHISREDGKKFLLECIRVMKAGSVIRLTVPDSRVICHDYLDGKISRHALHNMDVRNSTDDAQSLFALLLSGHQTVYDLDSLTKLLKDVGFVDIEKMDFGKSKSKVIEEENNDVFPELSLYLEAMKPDTKSSTPFIEVHAGNGPIITCGNLNGASNLISVKDKKDKLKIGLISTPFFTLPPTGYSGLEMVVWDLAMGLDELGHDVTIFAPEGSQTTAHGHLVVTGQSINTVGVDWLEEERKRYNVYKDIITPEKYDVIIDHTWFAFAYLIKMNNPKIKILHQHHGGYNWDSLPPLGNGKPNLMAISKFMREYTVQYFRGNGYNVGCEYVYNCVNLDMYTFDPNIKKSNRLLYVGRFSKIKGAKIAIEVAKKANLPIDLIGGTFIDDINYLKEIESMCDGDSIAIYKDVSHEFKIKKLQQAKALLVPSRFNEPFGLTCIEGMACGLAIVAFRDGAIPEVILDGKTGYICDNEEQMLEAIKNIDKINPLDCRERAYIFSRERMAKYYEKLCYRILEGDEW